MLNDSQRMVFKSLADNKALYEALKEYLTEKFQYGEFDESLTNDQIGAIARARYEGLRVVDSAFTEILGCKTRVTSTNGENPGS